MKHAVIVAHPNPQAYTHAVAGAYAKAVSALGDTAVLRDLYAMDFDPRLPACELPGAKDYAVRADVTAERAALADVDVFVLVYPFWFNAAPAILKGYLDRVFGLGFGYTPVFGGSEPALTGRRLLSLTSSGAPDRWVEETGALSALRQHFDGHLASVCGLSVLDHFHVGGIVPDITAEAVEAALAEVADIATRLFAPAS
jgi:NAD(P)H dehydrogenase (quinone)